jgi:hypothetical protein
MSYLTPDKKEVGYSLTRARKEKGYSREDRLDTVHYHKSKTWFSLLEWEEVRAMKTLMLVAVFILPTFVAAQEQSKETPQTMAVPTQWKTTDLSVAPVFGNIICGSDSSMYLRTATGKENPLEGNITVVSADGVSRTINPKEGIGFGGRIIFSAFNVDRDGALYTVANPSQEYKNSYIIAYDKEGHFVWKAGLHQPIHATFILPMANEHFLISGFLPDKWGVAPKTVTSVFDKGGNEIKSIKLPEDDTSISKDPINGGVFNSAVQLANARLDDDGKAYVFKGTAVPTVQVIDADGNVLKTFKLASPDANQQAYDFLLLKDSFAISYMPADQPSGEIKPIIPLVVVYDSKSGQQVTTYVGPETMSPSCSGNNTLTYIASTPDHKSYQMGTATLR